MCRPGIWAEIIAIVSVEPLPGLWLRLFLISRKYRKNEGLVRYFSKAHAQDWDSLPVCARVHANSRRSPLGGLARGRRRGHRRHCPQRPGAKIATQKKLLDQLTKKTLGPIG